MKAQDANGRACVIDLRQSQMDIGRLTLIRYLFMKMVIVLFFMIKTGQMWCTIQQSVIDKYLSQIVSIFTTSICMKMYAIGYENAINE